MNDSKAIILILGPTAGGKTQLSIDLATTIPQGGESICCDSMQVYRGMDIGTAKPTAAERAMVPHHLLDVADPSDDTFSVNRWLELAKQAIQEIRSRGRHPIIVGGTNLYVRAFLEGIMDGPGPDAELRSQLAELDLAELRAWLEQVDPPAAERIHINDRKRTIRAIEVFQQTGKRLSDQQIHWDRNADALNSPAHNNGTRDPAPDVHIIGLDYPVELINRRINQRVKAMMDQGLLEEVRHLHQANLLGINAREALGYKQIIDHLEGRCTLEEAIEQIKIRTRRYAKQQRTWLRRLRHFPARNSTWFDASDLTAQELAQRARSALTAQMPLRSHLGKDN